MLREELLTVWQYSMRFSPVVLRSARWHLSRKKVMPVATWNSTQEDSVRYRPYTMPAQMRPSRDPLRQTFQALGAIPGQYSSPGSLQDHAELRHCMLCCRRQRGVHHTQSSLADTKKQTCP